jgi:hypothetical protein
LNHLDISLPEQELAQLIDATTLEAIDAGGRRPDKPRQSGLVGHHKSVFKEEEIGLMNAIMEPNLQRYGYLAETS